MYYGKVSFADAYSMPVNLRMWWIKRINWVLEERQKAEEKTQRDAERINKPKK